ncbi:MAG: PIN domain-containing protein [Frankiaceae bacterium]
MAVVARYLVDKSALARAGHPAVSARLVPLIEAGLVATCALVDLEVLYSTRGFKEYERIRTDRALAYERLPMPDELWDQAVATQRELARGGRTRVAGIPDLLIAATAARAGLAVLHYDPDFDAIAEVTRQSVEWVLPRGSVA